MEARRGTKTILTPKLLIQAHMNLEQALLSAYPFEFYLGNAWSEWFAKRGSVEHAYPETIVNHYEGLLSEAKFEKAKFLGWAAAKIAYRDGEK
eukprot:4987445-Pyramimonas_sp.AAC.1